MTMTDPLSNLPQEVREAVEHVDEICSAALIGGCCIDAMQTIRAELVRVTNELAVTQKERDHWHEYADDYNEALNEVVPKLAIAEQELAALRARIDSAKVGTIVSRGPNAFGGFNIEVTIDMAWHAGPRVLVLDEGAQG